MDGVKTASNNLGRRKLPKYPRNERGNIPAGAMATISIARSTMVRRRLYGWTVADLANRTGLPIEVIETLESGTGMMSDDVLRRVDKAFGMDAGI